MHPEAPLYTAQPGSIHFIAQHPTFAYLPSTSNLLDRSQIPNELQYLAVIDKCIITQNIDIVESILPYHSENSYYICDSLGAQMFTVKEESPCLQRQLCRHHRAFTLTIANPNKQVIMKFERRFRGFFCNHTTEIFTGSGLQLGKLSTSFSFWCITGNIAIYTTKKISINDDNADKYERPDVPDLIIPMPCCIGQCKQVFEIIDPTTSVVVGKIEKYYGGYCKEVCTLADTFEVAFPPNLALQLKLLILGVVFLLDMKYFESKFCKMK